MSSKVKVGDKAPNFNLPDEKNRDRRLKEFLGQKVVLVFSIDAFTSACDKEICDFRDSIVRLARFNVQIIGIETNLPPANQTLIEKIRLPFSVLSDHKREVIKKYGLEIPIAEEIEGSLKAERSILILDEYGIVRYVRVFEDSTAKPDFTEIEKILEDITSQGLAAKVAPNVITISRQIGSGGDEIALKVSKILDYVYFDKNLMVNVAKNIGVSEEEIFDFSEDTYEAKSFVDKILLRSKPIAVISPSKGDESILKTLDEEECLSAIQTVISTLASGGKTVIVGRGGQAILKHKAGVVNVRIVAPKKVRIERIMKSEGLGQEAALKCIEDKDKANAEYLNRFYHIDWEDPSNYDLVLNTEKMDFNVAARIIAMTTLQPGYNLNEIDHLFRKGDQETVCICFDQKACDIHLDKSGNLVCRLGSNETVDGKVATFTCPLEIDSEKKKWAEFLKQELSGT